MPETATPAAPAPPATRYAVYCPDDPTWRFTLAETPDRAVDLFMQAQTRYRGYRSWAQWQLRGYLLVTVTVGPPYAAAASA